MVSSGSAMSCSSAISPTSSSTRSSTVTTPSVPPYSSTTTAMSARLLRSARQHAIQVEALRHVHRLPGDRRDRRGRPPHRGYAQRVLDGGDAGHGVERLLVHGEAAVTGLARHGEQIRDGRVGAQRRSTSTRGVIASAARLSPNRMVRRSRTAVSGGNAPARAEIAASRPSSSGERALASSSCGSTPSRRTIQLAVSLSPLINQANVREKTRSGSAAAGARSASAGPARRSSVPARRTASRTGWRRPGRGRA